MKVIKRKYVMSLVFDLVVLLVGSGLLYRLSLNMLESPSLNNLVFVIINAAVIGGFLVDTVFEAIIYFTFKKIVTVLKTNDEE